MRIAVLETSQAHQLHEVPDLRCFLPGRKAADAESNVLLNCQPGKQTMLLEDEAAVEAWSEDWGVPEKDAAAVVSFETGDDSQQSCLAAPASTYYANELAI